MKRWCVFLCLLIFGLALVSASIDVHNVTFNDDYIEGDLIQGQVNLTIDDEDLLIELTTNRGDELSLKDFLDFNGAAYVCDPLDCSTFYKKGSSGSEKVFSFGALNKSYAGFYIEGDEVEISSIDFSLSSDFSAGSEVPLRIKAFEGSELGFVEFSEEFSEKNFLGCFDLEDATVGPVIGQAEYCEKINLPDTDKVALGAKVDLSDNKNLEMSLYSAESFSKFDSCIYNPNSVDACVIDAEPGDYFGSGDYYVCVGSGEDVPTEYRLYEDSEGEHCGFIYSQGPSKNSRDYYLYARTVKYADGDGTNFDGLDFVKLAKDADKLIDEKYGRDCSGGCILPLEFSGIEQNLNVFDVSVYYLKEGGEVFEDKIFEVSKTGARVDYSGVLDLALSKFTVEKEGSFKIYLGSEKILDEDVEFLFVPKIESLYPVNPPAGIPVKFVAAMTFNSSKSGFSFLWDFGDNNTLKSETNSVSHTFEQVGNYTVKISVLKGTNFSYNSSFEIEVVRPDQAIKYTLGQKEKALANATKAVSILPSWYVESVREVLNISEYNSFMKGIKLDFSSAKTDADYVEIAKVLYSMDFPSSVFKAEVLELPFFTQKSDILPEIIGEHDGEGSADYEDYVSPILRWETEHLDAMVKNELVSATYYSGDSGSVLRAYSISLQHDDYDTAFFVINRPKSELEFIDKVDAIGVAGSTLIEIEPGVSRKIEFYTLDGAETTFFIAPSLSSLVTSVEVDDTCDFDGVCEAEDGENPTTCRSDCKPAFRMVLFLILAFVFVLFIYTLLQIWYKRHYEHHLFEDRRQLYNLLMFVSNARARGQTDRDIEKALRKQGWSGERVDYVMKKSRGENTGLLEIIPLSKFSASRRDKKALRGVVTQSQQQRRANFNKLGYPRH